MDNTVAMAIEHNSYTSGLLVATEHNSYTSGLQVATEHNTYNTSWLLFNFYSPFSGMKHLFLNSHSLCELVELHNLIQKTSGIH